jgi:hypothetical protein
MLPLTLYSVREDVKMNPAGRHTETVKRIFRAVPPERDNPQIVGRQSLILACELRRRTA